MLDAQKTLGRLGTSYEAYYDVLRTYGDMIENEEIPQFHEEYA